MVRSHVTRTTLRTLVLDALLQVYRDNNINDNDALVVARIAMARAFELWNQQSSSILRLLPPELLAECFSWFSDWHVPLAVVTATSRRFRAVALSAPSLWADVTSHDFRHGFHVSGIAMMLERSMQASFRLDFGTIGGWSESEQCQVAALLARNMYRAKTIAIHALQDMDELLLTPAPVLRELRVFSLRRRLTIRQSDWAPQLQHLELRGPFEVPIVLNPFRHLTHFFGHMHSEDDVELLSDARCLFRLCPQLKSMILFGINRSTLSLMPLAPVPAPLLSIELYCSYDEEDCDLSPYVSMWHGRHMEGFELDCPRALLILLQHLQSVSLRPLLLELERRTARIVTDNNNEYDICIREQGGIDARHWALITPYLCDLRTLITIDLPSVLSVAPTLPSLRVIEWITTWWEDEHIEQHARMHAPQLHTLRIRTRNYGQSSLETCTSRVPDMVLDHLQIDARDNKVPRIVILGETVEYVLSIEWMEFMRGTRALYVGDQLLWEDQ